ncbi:unnamed protein product [Clonostachys rosea]|uniref:YDG domain-containing protein n=1 Tax=Bionectria ochroleuca TaxID=29856 RepID=A0ABY6UMA5_BIOOC|nr:unnamed protein product [Clonostachys rosea]
MERSALNCVLGYVPTVPHRGYHGTAGRCWDFGVAGKDQITERQIHHYGSGLKSLVPLSAFRGNPSDSYLIKAGYAGTSGPLSNIHDDGFASCAMHARPEHFYYNHNSADYGQNFLAMSLGSGAYLVDNEEFGLAVYSGLITGTGEAVEVRLTDPRPTEDYATNRNDDHHGWGYY